LNPWSIYDKIKEDELGHVARIGQKRNEYISFAGRPKGERAL
jgi:hypothetical protein